MEEWSKLAVGLHERDRVECPASNRHTQRAHLVADPCLLSVCGRYPSLSLPSSSPSLRILRLEEVLRAVRAILPTGGPMGAVMCVSADYGSDLPSVHPLRVSGIPAPLLGFRWCCSSVAHSHCHPLHEHDIGAIHPRLEMRAYAPTRSQRRVPRHRDLHTAVNIDGSSVPQFYTAPTSRPSHRPDSEITGTAGRAAYKLPSFYLTSNYCNLAGLVLVLYDWIINLPREVEAFWRGDASPLSASLYFATRSISLAMAVMTAVGLAPWSDTICARGTVAGDVLICLSYIPLAVFSALRAYALSKRRMLSFVILIFFLVPSVTDAVRLKYLTSSVVIPTLGCSAVDNTPPELTLIFFITTRACAVLAILADALLLAITWRFLRPPGLLGVGFGGKGLVYVMLRDGAIYFILLLILNATDLVFVTYAILRASNGVSDSDIDAMAAISIFQTFLPSVLVSHFLLDLQEAHQRKVVVLGSDSLLDASSSSSSVGHVSRLTFQVEPSLGALGATVDPVDWETLDDCDEATTTTPLPPCPFPRHAVAGGVRPDRDDDECSRGPISPPGASPSPSLVVV